jgi:hypothetical protein
VLDREHGYRNADLLDFVGQFHAELAAGEFSTRAMADLAIAYTAYRHKLRVSNVEAEKRPLTFCIRVILVVTQ